MPRRPLPNRASALLLLGVALFAAGCGNVSSRQRMSMDTFQSSILFGFPSPKPQGATAPTLPPPQPTGLIPLDQNGLVDSGYVIPYLAPLAPPPCPVAGATAVPAEPATDEVVGLPAKGTYRWKQAGAMTIGGKVSPLVGLQTRLIRAVTQVSQSINPVDGQPNSVFTYQTVEPFPPANRLVINWQVKTDATQIKGSTGAGPVTISGAEGDPENGLAIKQMQLQDATGKALLTFAPATGLVVVVLPLTPNQAWTSTAADTTTGAQVVLNGQVGPSRLAIDACSDLVAGWPVGITLTYTGIAGGQQYTYSETRGYLFAPQYGGLIVYAQVKGDSPFATAENTQYTFGQIHPGPLPAGQ